MTGRGVDQILAHPSAPQLYEPYVTDARDYVELAERRSGPIPRGVEPSYLWGDALAVLEREAPSARIVNLETAVTRCEDYWPGKGINYRMHPDNVACLSAGKIDVAVLANNHTLDWGVPGLFETLETLRRAGMKVAGAGRTLDEALGPAVLALPEGGRLLVFSFACPDSGVPRSWAAQRARPGLALLEELSEATLARTCERIASQRREGDLVVASLHWGSNWGYEVPKAHRRFARGLIDGGVDLVHGHSSHHVRPMEVYRERLILYGCGDLLDDYEGISGHEEYRGDLALMFFSSLEAGSGVLRQLRLAPMQVRKLRLNRPLPEDVRWLERRLDEICAPFGCSVRQADGAFLLEQQPPVM